MSDTPSDPPGPTDPAAGATPRDALYWAKLVHVLEVGQVPPDALNLNVSGRRLVGPVQGFGKLWQKTYRVDLGATSPSPAEVIAIWKQHFASFWPKGNRFYGSLTGIAPGEVALLNVTMPGGLVLSTGMLVLYADEISFTLMTPQGHMFASWITFSAADQQDHTVVQVQALFRAGDPLYELALPLGGHRKEDRFWQHTLRSVAAHLGVEDARVHTSVVCLDRRRQWANAGNIWDNAAVRSALYQLATPLRWSARLRRRRER
jgi:hypothetical protein